MLNEKQNEYSTIKFVRVKIYDFFFSIKLVVIMSKTSRKEYVGYNISTLFNFHFTWIGMQ